MHAAQQSQPTSANHSPPEKPRAMQIQCADSTPHKSPWAMLLNVTPYQDLHGTQPDLLHYVLFLHLLALPKLGGMFCSRCEYVSGDCGPISSHTQYRSYPCAHTQYVMYTQCLQQSLQGIVKRLDARYSHENVCHQRSEHVFHHASQTQVHEIVSTNLI